MIDFANKLSKIGLSERESSVYLTLLDKGPLTVAAISKEVNLHRPTVYKNLYKLMAKGIVTTTPKGKLKLYVAETPEKLRHLFEDLKQDFEEVMPDLESMFERRESRPKIKYLEGKKGITFVFEDLITTLKKGETYYRYTSESEKDLRKANKYLPKDFRKRRDNKGIQRYIISNQSIYEYKKQKFGREIKTVPKDYDLFEYDVSQFIYGDKVAYVDYNTETALIIENPITALFQRKIFKLLYSKL